jgi:protein-disulfide isomerase
VKSGVHGTPTFFIDGVRHDAGWDAPTLLSALRAAILAKAA